MLFSSVSFFAILYSSWDGTGDPFFRENTLDYLPAGVTALFASIGGVLLKLSTNSFASKNTLESMVKIFTALLLFLVPIYVSSIISVVSGGEFNIRSNDSIWEYIKDFISNIYFVIIAHLTMEMIMVFLAMHHLIQLNAKRKKIIIEENPEYRKVEEFVFSQEKHIIKYMGIKADLKKICDSIRSTRNMLKTDYELKFDLHKKTILLKSKVQELNKSRGQIKENQLQNEINLLAESIKEIKDRENHLKDQIKEKGVGIHIAKELQLNDEIESIKKSLEELEHHA